jgi:hypothetical protein
MKGAMEEMKEYLRGKRKITSLGKFHFCFLFSLLMVASFMTPGILLFPMVAWLRTLYSILGASLYSVMLFFRLARWRLLKKNLRY